VLRPLQARDTPAHSAHAHAMPVKNGKNAI
jgi:hypothetical protein